MGTVIKLIKKMIHSNIFIFFMILGSTMFIALGFPGISNATAVTGFNAGRIIDDAIFTNSNSMSVSQIQAFLNSKVSTCDTNGTQPATDFGRPDLTHAQYAATRGWPAPPYPCLKDYNENGLGSAQIIYNVAQQYQINPQVLIVLLQKEQGLVTDTWPLPVQYRSATGYGCPDTAPCDSQYYGLTNQVQWSGNMFRSIMNNSPTWYTPYILGNNYIRWSPNSACGGSTVNIQNRSTQALYNYTPYQPNQASLNAGYGTGDSCSSHGNRNFYLYFSDWFGSTYAYIYNGVSYSTVFDANYYQERYTDIMSAYGGNTSAAFVHFANYGMREGRQASANFDVASYRNRYQDLRIAFGTNLPAYYLHYINFGKKEGRIATGDATIIYITDYYGIDYSAVYNFNAYITKYSDMKTYFGNDDASAIMHFINFGMNEGRQASDSFDVISYKNRYPDLRVAFGNNLKAYYIHYIMRGKSEGRIATGNVFNGISTQNGIDYSAVYNFNAYITKYSDMKTYFGNDDASAIMHFINFGMNEGRQASDSFDVQVYKSNYADLRAAFGNNLKAYYLHYITNGKKEGRVAI